MIQAVFPDAGVWVLLAGLAFAAGGLVAFPLFWVFSYRHRFMRLAGTVLVIAGGLSLVAVSGRLF